MHLIKVIFMATVVVLVASGEVAAKAPVWKITKGDNSIYLGGTIHVLAEKDYPLPAGFEVAYRQADTLVFETDIAAASSPAAQLQFMRVMAYSGAQTLRGELKPETYALLTDYLSSRGIPPATFDKFTPAGVSLTLTVAELQRLGVGATSGVDNFFNLRGKNDAKAIEALESLEQQLAFIEVMNSIDSDEVILSTIRDLEGLAEMWGELIVSWRNGDIDSLTEIALTPMLEEFPKLAKVLLTDRNNNWMQVLPTMFADADVEFVLVGSLHLVGQHGLLTQFRNLGYRVEQLD